MARFLVTAGNTREPIDQVRSWSNIFTGNTGLSIAKAIAQLGPVDLLTSNQNHLAELAAKQTTAHRIEAQGFTSHANLRQLLDAMMRQHEYDAVFMSAAVSDYRPAGVFAVVSRAPVEGELGREQWIVQDVQADKIKSSHGEIAILGEQTQKLVDLFRSEWNYKGLLVKFKLEVGISPDELIKIGQSSRISSGADYLVANTLEMVSGESAGAYLLSEAGSEWVGREQLPARMAQLVQQTKPSGSA